MGWFALAISVLLLLAVCRAWAHHFGESPGERFWIAVGSAGMQLGSLAVGLLLFRLVTPLGWLAAQERARC